MNVMRGVRFGAVICWVFVGLCCLPGCRKKSEPAAPAVPVDGADGPAGASGSPGFEVQDRAPGLRLAFGTARDLLARELSGREGAVRCEEAVLDGDLLLTLRGRESTWPSGIYRLDEAPDASAVARSLSLVYKQFEPYLSAPNDPIGLRIDVDILGSADAQPVRDPARWSGPKLFCTTSGRQVELNPDYTRVSNNLLGCARAGSIAASMYGAGVPKNAVKVFGRELTDEGGEYRYVEANLRVRNVFRLVELANLCR